MIILCLVDYIWKNIRKYLKIGAGLAFYVFAPLHYYFTVRQAVSTYTYHVREKNPFTLLNPFSLFRFSFSFMVPLLDLTPAVDSAYPDNDRCFLQQ